MSENKFDINSINIDNDKIVDAKNLKCPEPIMLLHNKIRQIDPGAVLKLQATDPSSDRDVSRFCDFLGHVLIHKELSTEEQIFFIRKKDDKNHS